MATKDKLINLEDLKVLSDHVEGEVTDLKSDLSYIGDLRESYDGTINATWEKGGFNQNSNLRPPCIYVDINYAIRTKEGITVHLKEGDIFSLTDFTGLNITIFGNKTSDGTFVGKQQTTSEYVVSYEGDYVLEVRNTNTAEAIDLETTLPKIILQTNENTVATVTSIQSRIKDFENIEIGNLMPPLTDWIVGRVYQGTYSAAVTTVKCTDFIPIVGGKKYYIYGGYINVDYFAVYGENKNVITGWTFDDVFISNKNRSTAEFVAPLNAKYIRLNLLVNNESKFPTNAYIGSVPNCGQRELDFSGYVPREKGSGTLSDKKVLVIGDSISTDVYGDYKKWVSFLCEKGFFSSGFVTNSSYHATGYVATYKESGVVKQGTFLSRLTALGDISQYDLIVTFGGINDWIQAVPFDDFTSAVDAYIQYVVEHATQARIAFLSPLKTSLYGNQNAVGKTQKDYDDYIKNACAEYSLPVLNLTDESGFCPDKSTTFMNRWTLLPSGASAHDGVHPIAEWEEKHLAPQIAWFLAGLI